jgi:hypothetical protein
MTANALSKIFLAKIQKYNPNMRIFRNNAGCFKALSGTWIKYGIPNSGGSDFISFTGIEITSDMVGKKLCIADFWEIKSKTDRISLKQKEFFKTVKEILSGNVYIVNEKNNNDIDITKF